ncbi:MAG: TonB family protein [Ignavibacteriaceae bacterium]
MIIKKIFLIISFVITTNIFAQQGLVKAYYENGKVKSEINYSNNVREGSAKFFYSNGNLKEDLNYINGAVDGVVKEYYENGKLKELYTIENGRREGATSFYSEDGNYLKDDNYSAGILQPNEVDTTHLIASAIVDTVYKNKVLQKDTAQIPSTKNVFDTSGYLTSAEIMPEPVGGIKSILNNLVYPQEARKMKIEGTVIILADIDEYGEVNYAKVLKGIGHGCNEAAKIAVFYAQFKPGMIKGKAVKVEMKIPIEFKLK